MNIIFMGSPEFATPALKALHRKFGVKAVVTNIDKPAGRGRKLLPTAVKTAAIELGIPLLQPFSLRDKSFCTDIDALQPDIICVIAFRILPASVYSLARLGAFNVHASLLPKFRGAAPIQRAIMEGEKETGVTSFLLTDVVDAGNVILRKRMVIPDGMTSGELYAALTPLAAEAAVETCIALQSGVLLEPQNNEQSTPAPKIFRDQCFVNWSLPVEQVRNFIHGVSPTPCAWTILEGSRLKIYRCALYREPDVDISIPGEFAIIDESFVVACGDGLLQLTEVQAEGKPKTPASDFIRGRHSNRRGRFGENL